MSNENISVVERYYAAMQQHDIATIKDCLHPDVSLISPLAEVAGLEAVLAAAETFSNMIQSLTIRSRFSSGNQVMLAYDFDLTLNGSIKNLRAAVLVTLENAHIICIELFFDARLFRQ